MINRIVAFAIARRWLIVLLCLGAVVAGAWSLTRLPIDAVPDITNKQVQINTIAPALSPVEIEKQVTFRIETALAGTPQLEYTRSLSRNGFLDGCTASICVASTLEKSATRRVSVLNSIALRQAIRRL